MLVPQPALTLEINAQPPGPIVHVTPTYFDDESIIGGGERYPSELAAWMARRVPTTLVSFSQTRRSLRRGPLQVEIYPVRRLLSSSKGNPLSVRFLREVAQAAVVHVHGVYTMVSDLACGMASMLGKPTFTTDYGGGDGRVLNTRLPILPRYRAAVAYSQFGLEMLPEVLRRKAHLIKGGIDTDRFQPSVETAKQKHILFVGRLLPHKGVNYLVEAFRLLGRPDYRLRLVGRAYHDGFYQELRRLADGLPVDFIHDADDARLIEEYRAAQVTVLPSVHRTLYGDHTTVPELMGFTLLESQACGTPVICTDAGAMHEFLAPGQTGLIAAQNSPESLCDALRAVTDWTGAETRDACVRFAHALNWESVVVQHLTLYASAGRPSVVAQPVSTAGSGVLSA